MVTIVDYRAGNLTSVKLAFTYLGVPAEVTAEPARILSAQRLVFPGVGAAGAAMRRLEELDLVSVLRSVLERGTPFLGMCLGAQIVLDESQEDGGVTCLGLIPGSVLRFDPSCAGVKVPHIGWNSLHIERMHPVLDGIENGSEFYFVHSFYPEPREPDAVIGRTRYAGKSFAAVLGRGNLVATQFHPEKSGRVGLRLLQNFSRWDGKC